MEELELQKILEDAWGDERPIWIFCPICNKVLESEGINFIMNGHGRVECKCCEYKYQQRGSYASLVTIKNERFGLDDMFSDSEKMYARIAELKESRK
jgi:hypothetical protein